MTRKTFGKAANPLRLRGGLSQGKVLLPETIVGHRGKPMGVFTQKRGIELLNRTVNLSVLVQLAFLASLIVGSWVNLQRQLDSLQRDVSSLLESQRRFT